MTTRSWLVPSLCSLLAVAWAFPAQGQAKVDVEVTPFVGGTFYLNGLPERFRLVRGDAAPYIVEEGRHDDALTLGVHGGLWLGDAVAVEAMFSWLPTSLHATAGIPRRLDANAFMYGGGLSYRFPVSWMLKPFLGVGVGAETYDYDADGVEVETEFMANVYGGLFYPISGRLGVRFEVRDCFTWFDPDLPAVEGRAQHDLMLTAGLGFRMPLLGR